MLEHYKIANTNVSATYKQSEKPVQMPHEYLDSLFDKKISKLAQGDYNVEDWVTDMNAFDQKFKYIITCNSQD